MEPFFQCRVCLNAGEIPIFDDENEDKSDLVDNICSFGSIQINKNDYFPKYLCSACLSQLRKCVLFRNTAQESDRLLKLNFEDCSEGKSKKNDEESMADCMSVSNNGQDSNENVESYLEEYIDSDEYQTDNQKSESKKNNMIMIRKDYIKETEESIADYMLVMNNEQNSNENVDSYLEEYIDEYQADNPEIESNKNNMIMIIVSEEEGMKTIDTAESSEQRSDEHNCSTCNMDFESLEDYQQHIKTKYHINTKRRANRVLCQICEKDVVASKYALHIEKHNKEQLRKLIFECKKCDIQFNSIEDFESHNNNIHPDKTKGKDSPEEAYNKLQCNICDKFLTLASYNTHLKLHGCEAVKEKTFRACPYCNKNISFSYLKNHIQRVHGSKIDRTETNYVCDKCGKCFKTKSVIELHVLTHGAELKYQCPYCPYRGLHQALLNTHVRTHMGQYNYKCTKCSAKFLTKSNLNKHLKRHRGPIDFKCSTCDKGFYTKLELDRHFEVHHLGSKKHICNVCGKAFGYWNNMMCHQLKVHKRQRLTTGKGRLPSYLQAEQNF